MLETSIDTVIQNIRTHQALLDLPVMSIEDLSDLPTAELDHLFLVLKTRYENLPRRTRPRPTPRPLRQATIRVIRMAQQALAQPVQAEAELAVKSGPELAALFRVLEKQL